MTKTSAVNMMQHTPPETNGHAQKKIYRYDAPWPLYAMDWCNATTEKEGFRLALGSFIEDHSNKFQIVTRNDLASLDDFDRSRRDYYAQHDFVPLAEIDSYYPITKVLWEPWKGNASRGSDLLVTSSDVLRLWELVDNSSFGQYGNTIGSRRGYQANHQKTLVKRAKFVNMTQSDFNAPITSFDWNEVDPSLIVTSSIDTTCTVWNVETCQAKSQLIAHDRDVYDVTFQHGSQDVFASVGADGSVRLFDLRSLQHSTILYEAPPAPTSPGYGNFASVIGDGSPPLLRIQFNRINPDLLATFQMDSNSVQILDVRYPSVPVAELTRRHEGSVTIHKYWYGIRRKVDLLYKNHDNNHASSKTPFSPTWLNPKYIH
ncbi:hypothetical protein DFQ28_009904 [Apophysomyces sp. BC1034]|nr:hypothetical protein DFQ29_007306 [Apophysomyces sp. BC1021]KAG0185132.1 hypothetical protein DFQ28_009904 [Apophysomyces sp. BC1034]